MSLQADLERLAEGGDFSGVIGLSRNGERFVELARGLADRANGRPIRLDTRFGIASATKGLTALTVASMIESGQLRYDTTLRSLLPRDLPMVDPRVTIEHLLGHTSGVGGAPPEHRRRRGSQAVAVVGFVLIPYGGARTRVAVVLVDRATGLRREPAALAEAFGARPTGVGRAIPIQSSAQIRRLYRVSERPL